MSKLYDIGLQGERNQKIRVCGKYTIPLFQFYSLSKPDIRRGVGGGVNPVDYFLIFTIYCTFLQSFHIRAISINVEFLQFTKKSFNLNDLNLLQISYLVISNIKSFSMCIICYFFTKLQTFLKVNSLQIYSSLIFIVIFNIYFLFFQIKNVMQKPVILFYQAFRTLRALLLFKL